ncbi:MAG: RagB/SusD family nutrient uptake outer membrane protein [Butyricimonas paravirosa]
MPVGDGNGSDDLTRSDRAGLERYDESMNPETLRREIFRERERELFGEGQRYYDAVRNGYLKELSDEYGR